MAMKALRILAVVAAVASLGSCQVLEFIFSSVFPSTVALAKAQADLSGQISSNNGYSFNVRVVESAGYGYVVVTGSQPSTGNAAYFFDLDLNAKATFTGLTGNGVMVDANGYIVVGSMTLNPDLTAAGASTGGVNLNPPPGGAGVDGFLAYSGGVTVEVINVSPSGSTLNYSSYDSNWTVVTSSPVALTSSVNLDGILDDGMTNGTVVFAVSPPGSGDNPPCTFVSVSKNTFPGTPAYSPQLNNLETKSFGFAQGSIFAYDTSSSRFVRLDPLTGTTQASFFVGADFSSTNFAYRISGGSFYGFNAKTRVLTKYTAWW